MKAIKNLAIVGATGLVGQTFLKVLDEHDFPFENLHLFASARSAGSELRFRGKSYKVREARSDSFEGIDLALFSAGKKASLALAPYAAASGCVAVDNSSAWRMHPHAPLGVPEVNPDALGSHLGIIGNPNCSTIQMVVALKPIRDNFGLKRVIVSTYQAVSGAGQKGIDQLESELSGTKPERRISPHQLANNLVFHDFDSGCDYSEEEIKMENETRKILSEPDLLISATCVRVPIVGAHGEAVPFETEQPFTIDAIPEVLKKQKGVVLKDNPETNEYPLVTEANGRDEVFVGRLRRDRSVENGGWMWVVSDNVRKGAATNAVQIAEVLLRNDNLAFDREESKKIFLP